MKRFTAWQIEFCLKGRKEPYIDANVWTDKSLAESFGKQCDEVAVDGKRYEKTEFRLRPVALLVRSDETL